MRTAADCFGKWGVVGAVIQHRALAKHVKGFVRYLMQHTSSTEV